MNHDPAVREPQQRDVPPEVDAERPKRKRHDHNIVGNLTPLSAFPGGRCIRDFVLNRRITFHAHCLGKLLTPD